MLQKTQRVMIIDFDPRQGPKLRDHLRNTGFACELEQGSGLDFNRIVDDGFEHVLVNLATGDGSGLQFVRRLREFDDGIGVIVISPQECRNERLMAIQAGADDFLIPPFPMSELEARIEAVTVRARQQSRLEFGPLRMDLTRRSVERDGKTIQLTPTEFRILELLLRNRSQVVTRRTLCEYLWNPQWEGVTNVIEVHINRLRSKLNYDGKRQLIHTVRGRGYVLKWQPETELETIA